MTATASPFHYHALLVTVTDDRQQRRQTIRHLGQNIYADRKTVEALHEFMRASIDMRPDLANQLLGDFNSALDGIGSWRC